MPRMDNTGPEGKGPKTGRKLGSCKGAFLGGFRSRFNRVFRRGRNKRLS